LGDDRCIFYAGWDVVLGVRDYKDFKDKSPDAASFAMEIRPLVLEIFKLLPLLVDHEFFSSVGARKAFKATYGIVLYKSHSTH
jgi:hypothetical protein